MKHLAFPAHQARFAVLAMLALLAPACGNRGSSSAPAAASATAPAPPQPAAEAPKWITHKSSGTKFHPPAGWSERKDADTRIYFTPEGGAVLAFEEFDRGTDPGKLILEVSRKLNLSELDWRGGTKEVKFGKDQIPGRTADGDCTVKGEAARYSYATMATGSPKEMLILYYVKKSAPKERKTEAMESLRSMERI